MSASGVLYLAGFFDGEGSVTVMVHAGSQRVGMRAYNTNPAPIYFMQHVFGGGVRMRKKQKPHYKDCYEWYASGPDTLPIMKRLLPHSLVKREVMLAAIELEELRQRHYALYGNGGHSDHAWHAREALREKILALNGHPVGHGQHRGRVVKNYSLKDRPELRQQGAEKSRHIRASLLEPGREADRAAYLTHHRKSEQRRRENQKTLRLVSAPLAQEA